MKSKIVILIFIITGSALFYFLCGIFSFNLGDNIELLQNYKYENKVNINIYYIPSNATSNDYIQVRIKDMESKTDTIINFEKYNYIVNSGLDGPLLNIVLKDTSVHHINRIDTFIVNINGRSGENEQ